MNKEKIFKLKNYRSLLIILLIVLILIILIYFISPNCMCDLPYARCMATQAQIELLITSLDTFYLDMGRYPTSEEGLPALVSYPIGINKNLWKGPYLKKQLPIDPWGNNYNYRYDSTNEKILLYSYGRDGTSKTDGNDLDDINNWDKNRKWSNYYRGRRLFKRKVKRIIFYVLIILIVLDIYLLIKIKNIKKGKVNNS